ncbi:uncharacterized protein LOC107636406 [Arachis ipaensis]|uniref:uncharacterized protein LOC107636406 n=1 Tax=Arachis ipaensis TaxID=130454 RepID=UPI0007AFD56E|nr:uncharacterized protein LOC107636406 [Arachis ipaensis]XP_025647553.1 uncharacterized protein LOC112742530 [Arachis hypogaea]
MPGEHQLPQRDSSRTKPTDGPSTILTMESRSVRAFPGQTGQVKYLIVAIDYYTKWVETEPLSSISSANCQKFMWRQVIAKFGVPEVVISDNGTQFSNKKFGEFLTGLGIRQKLSSVEHPQTNGQVEAANKVILQGLKKRLDQKKGALVSLGPLVLSHNTAVIYRGDALPAHLWGGCDNTRGDRETKPTTTFARSRRSRRKGLGG